jgi:hypothetical protein
MAISGFSITAGSSSVPTLTITAGKPGGRVARLGARSIGAAPAFDSILEACLNTNRENVGGRRLAGPACTQYASRVTTA